jgi:hypothetical protein
VECRGRLHLWNHVFYFGSVVMPVVFENKYYS